MYLSMPYGGFVSLRTTGGYEPFLACHAPEEHVHLKSRALPTGMLNVTYSQTKVKTDPSF